MLNPQDLTNHAYDDQTPSVPPDDQQGVREDQRERSSSTRLRVRDLALAEWGRKTMQVCEHEMPGLMAIRKKYGPQKPLKGVRITGSLHMTIETPFSSRRSPSWGHLSVGRVVTFSPRKTTPQQR